MSDNTIAESDIQANTLVLIKHTQYPDLFLNNITGIDVKNAVVIEETNLISVFVRLNGGEYTVSEKFLINKSDSACAIYAKFPVVINGNTITTAEQLRPYVSGAVSIFAA